MQADEAALGILVAAYPGREMSESSIKLYGQAIRNYPPDIALKAVEKLASRNTAFMPSYGELVTALRDGLLEANGEPPIARAWEMVTDPATEGQLPTLVLAALRAIGGRATITARQSSGEGWAVRRDFERAYELRREEASMLRDEQGHIRSGLEEIGAGDDDA